MDIDGPTQRLGSVRRARSSPTDDPETAPLRALDGHFRDQETERHAVGPSRTDRVSDDRDDFLVPDEREHDDEPPRRQRRGRDRRGRGRRTGVLAVAVAVLLVALAGGSFYLYRTYLAPDPDYPGAGEGDVVVQVAEGDSTAAIGRTLQAADVVASVGAFLSAAEENDSILGVQPGSYQMRSQMSAAAAVERLLDPAALVGRLEIRGGVQLDDTRGPDGTVAPGVLSLISEATCSQVNGEQRCVSVEDLGTAMAETDPAELGVPEWARDGVGAAEPRRRLEGLLAAGIYDVQPGQTAVQVLQGLLAGSVPRLEATGLVAGADALGMSPYEMLIISSLVEKEAITADMPRVSRVIYNRLDIGQRLEFDSTVNYPLDLQALATTDADRETPGPYNTYRTVGLTPTPIAAVGNEAVAAALAPEPGPWLYFVRCETDGRSCFAATFEEHNENRAIARANGAF